jgi:hypothetical protein
MKLLPRQKKTLGDIPKGILINKEEEKISVLSIGIAYEHQQDRISYVLSCEDRE